MTTYKKGFIYMIFLLENPDIRYIGSSLNERGRDRWASHKKNFKKWMRNKETGACSIFKYFEQYGIEKFKFQIIKKYGVCDSVHLRAYEQLYINKLTCINQLHAFGILSKIRAKESRKRYYENEENKERKKENDKKWREENKERKKENDRKWREENRERKKENDKKWHESNKEACNEKSRHWYETVKNTEEYKEKVKEYYEVNKESILEKRKREKVMCVICKYEVTKANFKRHLDSVRHQKKVNAVTQ